MKIRRFIGKDMREALNKVKHELGGDAVIMSNKKTSEGIEIVAAYDEPSNVAAQSHTGTPSKPAFKVTTMGSQTKASENKPSLNRQANASRVPSLSEIIGDNGPESLKALLEQQSAANPTQSPDVAAFQSQSQPTNANIQPQRAVNKNTHKEHSRQSNSHELSAIEDIKQELNALRNVLQFQVNGLIQKEKSRNHPLHSYLVSRLVNMGVSHDIADEICSYTPTDADERQAWLFILRLLANKVQTTGNSVLTDNGIVALVGPTGTGKTTTIAKLAAKAAQKYGAQNVALVTIDSYRIAAYEQLATYAKIIGCSVKKAQNSAELSDILFQLRNKRLVLIDTAGFGQRDSRLIKQLDMLNEQRQAEIKKYVVMQANAQCKVLERVVNAYKSVSLQGCILTKLDECYSLGEALSAVIEHKLAISYITDGQKVPEDIKVADAKYIVSTAAKLYKKYGLNHTDTLQEAI